MRDIKITHIAFKYGQLDKTPIAILDVKIQSAQVVDQSKFLVNTSLETRKNIQSMENKVEKLNKKLEQLKGDCSQKDKMVARLQEAKVELEKLKKHIEELKAQSNAIEQKKLKK